MRKLETPAQTVDSALQLEKEADVKAEEVASLTQTISRKFSKQKFRNRGFKRPAED